MTVGSIIRCSTNSLLLKKYITVFELRYYGTSLMLVQEPFPYYDRRISHWRFTSACLVFLWWQKLFWSLSFLSLQQKFLYYWLKSIIWMRILRGNPTTVLLECSNKSKIHSLYSSKMYSMNSSFQQGAELPCRSKLWMTPNLKKKCTVHEAYSARSVRIFFWGILLQLCNRVRVIFFCSKNV